jgi:Tfp pilus assembly protein PilF
MPGFRAGLLATALVSATLVGLPAVAQDRAVAALIDQANYWKLQNRPDQVVRVLERVLQADPGNAEALAGIAEAQAQQGNATAAQDALGRLRQIAPADPRTSQVDVAVRTQTVDAAALAQARQLAQSGRGAEAVQAYRQLFRGTQVPDSFALEYYQTLAGTEGGWREGRDGLAALARRAPNNTSVQLAYAQILTYREDTRQQGLEILRRLSGRPDSQQSATAAWRQALTWLGPGPDSVQPLEGYLQQFPNDAEIQRRLEEARNPPGTDPFLDDKTNGWRTFNAGRLREAEQHFQAVVTANPSDPDGLGGLGLVRLRQGRRAEARQLLQAAIDADPSKRANWERALQGASQTGGPARPGQGGGGAPGGGTPGPDIQTARNLVDAGNFSEAGPLLQRIVARNGGDRPDAEALLGDIAMRQGNAAQAEQLYRAALSRRSNFGAALSGLAGAMQAQGRFGEAEEIYRRLGQVQQPQVRADALRAEASRTEDPGAAAALLRAAIQAEPNNVWPRLDLARLMARHGQGAQARAMMEESVAGRAAPDAIHAAAIFANEQSRYADVVRLLERLPQGVRSADQNRLLASARVQGEVASAVALARSGRRQEARQRLLTMASRPDPTGEAAPAAVRALNQLNEPVTAQQAARAAAIASRGQSPTVRLAAAGALMEAGLDMEAAQVASTLDPSRLSPDQRRAATQLQAGMAIRASDQLNRQGDQATAWEVLAPTLRQDPQNVQANLALARLHQSAREPEQAQRIAEAVLSRNPRDTDARQAAVDAAIAARDWGRAEALLSEGKALLPGDARMALLEARLARAWGDQRRARAALEEAAQLRRQQIGLDPRGGGGIGVMAPQATVPQQPPASYDNPFRRVPLSGNGGFEEVAQAGFGRAQPGEFQPYQPGQFAPYPPGQFQPSQFQQPQFQQPQFQQPQAVPGQFVAPQFVAPQFVAPQVAAPQFAPGQVRPGQPMQGAQYAQAMMGNAPATAPPDPLLGEITRQLQEVREEAAPRVTPAFGMRMRSGDAGIDRLIETSAGGEGSVAMPGIGGRLTARATAVNADIGTMPADYQRLRRFGSLPLTLARAGDINAPTSVLQAAATGVDSSATGVALAAAYTRPNFSLDIGTTPLGFNQTNFVGGIEVAPEITDGVRLRLVLERRAMTDSLLAWGGLTDPGTRREWGGVVRTGARAQLELALGETNFYLAGGYYQIEGSGVADNSRVEFGAGFQTPVWRGTTDELLAGVDLVYFAYDQNLRFFTLGHGGYFSPQSFMALNVPVDYRGRSGNFAYRLGGTIGFATFTEDRTPVFPDSAALQSQLAALATGSTQVSAFYPGQTKTGITGGLRGDIEYMITPQLRIGAALRFDQAADWSEGRGLVYARYRFDR